MEINDFLKEYFNQNDISQKEIVARTKISQSKLSLIFNNKRKLTANELLRIAILFDINLEEMKNKIKHSD